MTTTQQAVKQYIQKVSNGVLNITEKHCSDLINLIVSNVHSKRDGVAKLFKLNAMSNSHTLFLTRSVSDEVIKTEIVKALENGIPQTQYLYMWECYNSAGEFEGRIFTMNCDLF